MTAWNQARRKYSRARSLGAWNRIYSCLETRNIYTQDNTRNYLYFKKKKGKRLGGDSSFVTGSHVWAPSSPCTCEPLEYYWKFSACWPSHQEVAQRQRYDQHVAGSQEPSEEINCQNSVSSNSQISPSFDHPVLLDFLFIYFFKHKLYTESKEVK